MKKLLCFVICLCTFFLCSCSSASKEEGLTGDILALCNEQRKKEGVAALETDAELSDSALIRASEISTDGNFNHIRPDGSGCFTVIKGEYSFAGENLARGKNDAAEIVSAWMASPDHKKNIMNPDFTRAGIAFIKSGDLYYYVMLFSG